MWGTPLVVLLCGGGLFFMIYSGFTPFRYFKHAIEVLRGKYDDPDDPGDINHFEALSSALAATVGLGNISGVAVAIAMGGPGAVFWMWVSAFVGMATKFFTCTLSIMYRGEDSEGNIQGGTMYMIVEGLGKKWKPLAMLFAVAGLFGPLPIFQANQLTQALREIVYIPNGWVTEQAHFGGDLITGIIILIIVSLVIFGGIKRIGKVASRMVPAMVVLYMGIVLVILAIHIDVLPYYLKLIVTDAFSAQAVLGGAVGQIIITGFKRAAFSNEAGIGTATLAHGAAKTKEPVREGLVAMMGPAIDTLLVCTLTALAILVTGVWEDREIAPLDPEIAQYTYQLDEGANKLVLDDGEIKGGTLTLTGNDIEKLFYDEEKQNTISGTVVFKGEKGSFLDENGDTLKQVYATYLENGISLTASAFGSALGKIGGYLLMLCVAVFAFSSLFTYSYYGSKSFGFLVGADRQKYYNYFYAASIIFGAVASIDAVIDLIDGMYAVMAIPTMTAALLLAPKVKAAATDYFSRIGTFKEYK